MSSTVATRRRLLLLVWLSGAAAILAQSYHLQIVSGYRFQSRIAQLITFRPITARRGAITDRFGRPFASSELTYRYAIAPREIRAPEQVRRRFLEVGIVLSQMDSTRGWIVIPQRQRGGVPVERVRGVYYDAWYERRYCCSGADPDIIGRAIDGKGIAGIEAVYDTLLRGTVGAERMISAVSEKVGWVRLRSPTSGRVIRTTLDMDAQDRALKLLELHLRSVGALGGVVAILERESGNVLVATSAALVGPRTSPLAWRLLSAQHAEDKRARDSTKLDASLPLKFLLPEDTIGYRGESEAQSGTVSLLTAAAAAHRIVLGDTARVSAPRIVDRVVDDKGNIIALNGARRNSEELSTFLGGPIISTAHIDRATVLRGTTWREADQSGNGFSSFFVGMLSSPGGDFGISVALIARTDEGTRGVVKLATKVISETKSFFLRPALP
jgi:hypothetical protein